jgi:hypothetical protein
MLNALVNNAPCSAVVQTLSCCPIVGGIPRGNGTGKSKQLAKEEAARQASASLGWATGASGPYHCALSERFPYVKELLTRTLIIHQRAVQFCVLFVSRRMYRIAIDVYIYDDDMRLASA